MSRGRNSPELAAAVHVLAKADVVAFGGVGFAGQILPATEAYRTVADALARQAQEVRTHVDGLLASGSAAGKVYAATLLELIDPPAARAAWRTLSTDPSELVTFSGCLQTRTTLARYALERAAAG
jgi:hypothetical protein